jgi:molybdopterin molybdotransferase
MTPAEREGITGLILAGGQSRRMGGQDKGLIAFKGKRLVDHVFGKLTPQVGGVLINTNQNHDEYKSFGVRVVSDAFTGHAGPLAGLHAGLAVSRRPYLMTVPCDSPFFPADLVERLFDSLASAGVQVAVAVTGEQPHPVFALVRRNLYDHLSEFMKGGGRKIDEWYSTLKIAQVDFGDEVLFGNINTPEELEAYEQGKPPPPKKPKRRFDAPLVERRRRAPVTPHDAVLDEILGGAGAAPDARKRRRKSDVPTEAAASAVATGGPAAAPVGAIATSLEAVVSCIDGYDPNALPVAKVNEVVRAFVHPVEGVEQVAIRSALGRTLAEDIISPINVPAHDNSAMDGWAVRGSDLSKTAKVTLEEIGTALAGKEFSGKVSKGECVRITTGAVMPHGCDTVIPLEIVEAKGKKITIPAGQETGANRRFAGEDLEKGKPALLKGKLIHPAELGLLASLGIPEVKVTRRLRVAFFSTGSELKSLGESLSEGEVYDSNRYTLFGMLQRLGVDMIDMGVVPDDEARLEAAFRSAAANADAVITSGGVSVGEADFTKQMMKKLGEVVFWRIAMRPGRPMAFGNISDGGKTAYLFGLPGNPVAVMVTFYHFVRGALLHMMGRSDLDLPLLKAVSQEAIRKKPGRTEYQRGILELKDGMMSVRTTGQQGSGVLRSMSEANCFVVLGHDQGSVKPGDPVDVMLFDGLV